MKNRDQYSLAYLVLYTILCAVLFLLLAACALICVEAIWRGSFSDALMWAARMYPTAALYIAGIALIEATLYILTGRLCLSVFAVNILLMLIAMIQHYKLEFRGENFLLGDVALISEAIAILDKFVITVPWYVALGCALLMLAPLCTWGIRIKRHMVSRLAGFCVCAALSFGYFTSLLNINNTTPLIADYYNLHGVLAGLVWSRPKTLTKPEGYSSQKIEGILSKHEKPDTADMFPDILFIMNESLYDLGRLDQMKLSEDTMPYLRRLQEEHWGSKLYVVSLGGGTVHSEYAVLTGYMSDPRTAAPYLNQKLVHEGMLSIPELLKEYGYYTMAMHPNDGAMYNRKNAYPRMGFEEMFFVDDMAPVNDKVGQFPSDAYLYKEIIRRYEERPSERPWFSFVVTYQNHGGYSYDYEKREISVTDQAGNLLDEATTYANALKASDEALEMLIAYFEKQERPVVLVLFGDHAPAMESLGYRRENDLDEEYLLHTTPALVYSNYGLDMQSTDTMASYRLGASVLDAIGLCSDRYYNYLADPARENLLNIPGVVIEDNMLVSSEERYTQAYEELAQVYYDRIAGKQFSRKGYVDE